ncbi:MAG TPA: ribosome maturation factor RimP [Actinomycetota bacterium]
MTQRQRQQARQRTTPSSAPVADVVRATCEQIVARRGLELVELSLGREGRGQVLRIIVDDPAGSTSLDEVAEVSEEISRALDAEDPIPGRYTLEVSSAGLERPLVRPSDYRRFTGRQVKVRTLEPIEGRRTFTGSIRSVGDDTFVLDEAPAGGGDGAAAEGRAAVVEIPYVAVARARLVVDWEDELRGRPAGPVPGAAGQPGVRDPSSSAGSAGGSGDSLGGPDVGRANGLEGGQR